MDITESENGFPQVRIQPDKLKAYLEVLPPVNTGLPCTAEDVKKALGDKGIICGIIPEQIENALKESNWGKQFVVAEGKAVIDGKDGFLEYVIRFQKKYVPVEDEKGNVNYHDLGITCNVRRGEPLVKRVPPVVGEKGIDITGQELLPRTGKNVVLPRGKNTVCDEENTLLYAAIDGHAGVIEGKIFVDPVFTLNGDVDLSSGDLDFVGDIVIMGNVTSGFSVKSEGNIEIRGFVEGAMLTTDGNVVVKGGIKTGSKGFVKAKENIIARFVENSRLEAGKDIIIGEAIMQSYVRAGGSVVVKEKKATIVGGIIQASDTVEAKVLGSQLATQTVIEVGVNPYHREEYQALFKERTQKLRVMENLNYSLQIYQRIGMNPQDLSDAKKMALIKMLDEYKEIKKQLGAMEEKIVFLEEEINRAQSGKVKAHGIAYPGVSVTIGSCMYIVNDAIKFTQFILDEGEIRLSSLR
ncbi:MAG: FapA family protein [Bacillota bacterium]|nr:FapA family protein [Bacillota bacterium]